MNMTAPLDPDGPGLSGYLFGVPVTYSQAGVVVLPVPWEVTVSSKAGTASAPEAIREASLQVDLFVRGIPDAWKLGIYMPPTDRESYDEGEVYRRAALRHIRSLTHGERADKADLLSVNTACEKLNHRVREAAEECLKAGKMVGALGGDHSAPLGLMQALSAQERSFAILQIDAHADLRTAYEGFVYSHASIMHNALKLSSVEKLVQVGIRDYGLEESEVIARSKGRITTFYDEALHEERYRGVAWHSQCKAIVEALPERVYISFDVDGLDPSLCPHTGTPVPGGLTFYQAAMLVASVAKSGRKIIGFDLSEVGPHPQSDWDANVGARLLYMLCNWMAVSQGKLVYMP